MPSIWRQSACACGRSGRGPAWAVLSSSPMGAASYASATTNASGAVSAPGQRA
jgi:hypothetical protein